MEEKKNHNHDYFGQYQNHDYSTDFSISKKKKHFVTENFEIST